MDEEAASDPDMYTPSALFNQAIRVTQAEHDMPLLRGWAGAIETQDVHNRDAEAWPLDCLECKYRVPIQYMVARGVRCHIRR